MAGIGTIVSIRRSDEYGGKLRRGEANAES